MSLKWNTVRWCFDVNSIHIFPFYTWQNTSLPPLHLQMCLLLLHFAWLNVTVQFDSGRLFSLHSSPNWVMFMKTRVWTQSRANIKQVRCGNLKPSRARTLIMWFPVKKGRSSSMFTILNRFKMECIRMFKDFGIVGEREGDVIWRVFFK